LAFRIVEAEMREDRYHLDALDFGEGDTIVDVGGHIGLFAIYAATRWPGVQIHSFEPFPNNAKLFRKNVDKSGLRGIRLHEHAVREFTGSIRMTSNELNSGNATSFSSVETPVEIEIPAETLDDIFEREQIEKCALLKLDCEGAEYGILQTTKILGRVEHVRGELHVNYQLEQLGYSPQMLVRYLLSFYPKDRIRFNICAM